MLPYGIVTLFLLFTLAAVAINVVMLVWQNGWITFLHLLSAFEGNRFLLLIVFLTPAAILWSFLSHFARPRPRLPSNPTRSPDELEDGYSVVPISSGDPLGGQPRETRFQEAES